MKTLQILASTLLFSALALIAPALAQADTVDLQKELPKQLTITAGETLVFENGNATVTTKDTDGKGQLFESRPHNTNNQAASIRATRAGSGEITVQTQSQGLLTVARTYVIKVTVNPAPPAPTPKGTKQTLEYSAVARKTAAKEIELTVGDSLEIVQPWTSDPGLFEEPLIQPTVKDTDGKAGNVVKNTSPANPTFSAKDKSFSLWSWTALRAGTTEVTFKNSLNGKEVHVVKVTVKDAPQAQATTVTDSDNGKTVTVAAGTEVKVNLRGNITTGSSWSVTATSGSSAKQDGEAEYVADDPSKDGSPGSFNFKFKTSASGSTTVDLQYGRPGQKSRTFSFTIEVK